MTRIEEMEEFFNFEDATNPALALDGGHRGISLRHSSSSLYDIDLILAEAADDDDSFNSLQHFDIDPPANAIHYASGNVGDVHMGGADDFDHYPQWINGVERPSKPCLHCRTNKLDCVLVPIGNSDHHRRCMSCTALSRQCSFSFEGPGNDVDFRPPFQPYNGQTLVDPSAKSACLGKDGYGLRCSMLDRNPDTGSIHSQPDSKDEGNEASNRTGARFSRETVRLLRNWLSIHHVHPYPTEEEKEDLKRKTGLTKMQITNWLANARRRGQVKAPRTISPGPQTLSTRPVNIPKRSKSGLENMDPMERWACSPPEHEPASVLDIAKAVKTSPNIPSNETSPDSYPRSDDGSTHSVTRESSTSSRNTSHSSRASHGSGLSLHSRGSFGSFGQRGRRRRRPVVKAMSVLATGAPRPYQCTFCIETFKTKHDWQRHEKSLHLSLERWVCAPNVAKVIGTPHKCAFCAVRNPDVAHYETHNYTVCQERSLEERTFYRKDHLRQHLRLVHECPFLGSSMESWKIAAPQVRSRCGFCGLTMETWSARVDHLAEHFKAGKTMADWKGSWGFTADVQKLVENGSPPYLIHSKRMAAMSKEATPQIKRESLTPYDQVKGDLLEFANNQALLGRDLTDDDLRAAASRIMANFKRINDPQESVKSWFRELIMCPDDTLWLEELRKKASVGLGQRNNGNGDSLQVLDIDNKDSVEQYCEFERQLTTFVDTQRSLGLNPTDAELKAAGCRIVMEYDRMNSTIQSATVATWFCEQIMASQSWTEIFRRRVGLPSIVDIQQGQNDPSDFDQTIHNYQTLEAKLAKFSEVQANAGLIPSDSDLQRQARLIIYEVDDPFLQTAADDAFWLVHFKHNHGLSNVDSSISSLISTTSPGGLSHSMSPVPSRSSGANNSVQSSPLPQQQEKPRSLYVLQDAKCYRRLELELSRFVSSCMSKDSLNPHVPTDVEIRQQARWIMYNDDSQWNQTAVDNEEWLLRFKRSNGLASPEDGPGMPKTLDEVDMHFGGTGLTPGNLRPEDLIEVTPITQDNNLTCDWRRPVNSSSSSPHNASLSVPRFATHTTFSSWKLESALTDYVQQSRAQGYLPSDEQLRSQARIVMGTAVTSADDPKLLQDFKELHGMARSPLYTHSSTQEGSINFPTIVGPSSNAYLANKTNMETEKLTTHWVPAKGRSGIHGIQEQHGLGIHAMQNNYTSAPSSMPMNFNTSMSGNDYHSNIDPELWTTKELSGHLSGVMGGYHGTEGGRTYDLEGGDDDMIPYKAGMII